MLCNTASIYPDGIDEMLFFQDNNIEKMDIINHYENLISNGKYDEANLWIENQQGIYGYFADFFNAIENRIFSLQEYLLGLPQKEQPFVYYEGDEFPLEQYKNGTHDVLNKQNHNVLNKFTHDELQSVKNVAGNLQVSNNLIIWI